MLRSLAKGAGRVNQVTLLGYSGKVAWEQTDQGLVVTLPEQKISPYTCAVKVVGSDLKPVPAPQ